jgi:hypothetical protein
MCREWSLTWTTERTARVAAMRVERSAQRRLARVVLPEDGSPVRMMSWRVSQKHKKEKQTHGHEED